MAILFEGVFGKKWQTLPEIFKRHYNVRDHSSDQVIAKGTITVNFPWPIKIISPLLTWFGLFPPYKGTDIPITVIYSAQPDPNAFCFNRTFHYPNHPPYQFKSRMKPLGGNVVVELTKFNIGWKSAYDYIDEHVTLTHIAYVLKLFDWYIPLPIGLIMGKCNSAEYAIDNNNFKMEMQIKHPWFGTTYEYYGTFTIE